MDEIPTPFTLIPGPSTPAMIDGEARLLDPDDVARQAAQDLGAEMDPGLPACVQNILTHSPSSDPGSLINADSLGAFIVATARAGVRIIADLRENLAPRGTHSSSGDCNGKWA